MTEPQIIIDVSILPASYVRTLEEENGRLRGALDKVSALAKEGLDEDEMDHRQALISILEVARKSLGRK